MSENKKELDEPILEDDYPVFWDYLYVADGKVVRSDVKGTVADLRYDLRSQNRSAEIITKCDLAGRGLL